MFLSVFDIFKIGIGPSSSHTVGPMVAASYFLEDLRLAQENANLSKSLPMESVLHIKATLHGSLAFTGKGHATDRAVVLGLLGQMPQTIDIDESEKLLEALQSTKLITLPNGHCYQFDPAKDVIFDYDIVLPYHTNGMTFEAFDAQGQIFLKKIYYSVGGGFVVRGDDLPEGMNAQDAKTQDLENGTDGAPTVKNASLEAEVPYPFSNAREMLAMAEESGLSIAQMKRANEEVFLSREELNKGLDAIWEVMNLSLERGLKREGILPGGLNIARRAPSLYQKLLADWQKNEHNPFLANDWLSVYALAVNEENAVGGRVVTAPTNGAAGVIPAVIKYYLRFYGSDRESANREAIHNLLLTSAAIGGLLKCNASISGAEVGCQGEVGSASSMAAAGLVEALGGTPAQVENAAEIALEHHLGLTCDPVAGLVQAPCIERNAFGAVKAATAASLAMHGSGRHFVPLDSCIETMRQTGLDMSSRYKETSQGGLAINVSVNRPNC